MIKELNRSQSDYLDGAFPKSIFCIVPALPVDLQSTSPDLRLNMIRMAVLKIMDMNNSLYIHLHSDTFDVPGYEKENILYNNEVILPLP